jgi:hypothetical protein
MIFNENDLMPDLMILKKWTKENNLNKYKIKDEEIS